MNGTSRACGARKPKRFALAGGEPARELVLALWERVEKIPELERLVAGMAERVAELERQVNRDSRNSSMPPSSDPPKSRAERRREAREKAKQWSKRKPGGQPGHEGKTREMASPERVDEVIWHLPERCGCGHAFDGSEPRVGEPLAHQKWELPPAAPLVIEHRRARLACPGCGRARLAELPAGVTASAFGPRLEAHIATLAGVFRLSRRQVRRVVEEMLGGADLPRRGRRRDHADERGARRPLGGASQGGARSRGGARR